VRLPSERALDRLLRGVGLVVWMVIGAPVWSDLGAAPPSIAWVLLYMAFAVLFVAATRPGASERSRRALVACESGVALALVWIGMPHFEGALLAVVAAQTPAVVSPSGALAWDVAQAAALFPAILPTHGYAGAAKAIGEYLAFALFALAVVYLRERETAARRELAQANSILLATQVLLADDARTNERLRVAREVHDAIGHGLSAASIHLQLAARTCDGKAGEAVAAAREAVSATLADVRGLVGAMRDDATIDLGTAVRAMCAAIREPTVHVAITSPLRVADPARAHAMFRCVQEALTNALRHARASEIWIDVESDARGLHATVRDDGVGAAELEPGNGLDGVRARLAEVSGTLAIETVAGHGLALRAFIPREVGT
jgi:signal transduction histidine kinase